MASINVPSTSDQKQKELSPQQPNPDATRPSASAASSRRSSKILTSDNAKATGKFLTAFGKTAVGMHPLWLMGEAVTGKKVGTQYRAASKELIEASVAMRDLIATSATDVVIIVTDQLRQKGGETAKTADVIKQAGDNAIVVVSTSIDKAQDQIRKNSPALKRSIQKNGKEVIIIVDKALKHPLVITGVHSFAKSKGIPRPEAILTVASLALSKILATFPTDEELAAMERAGADHVDEIDAGDFDRMSTKEAEVEAEAVGKEAKAGAAASASAGPSGLGGQQGSGTSGPQKKGGKKDSGCVLM